MTWSRLVRAETRKLTSTKMPLAFLIVLVVLAAINAAAVAFGTDMDGSKAFIATAADQQSLIAFAFNAFLGAGLFGAIAVAREYGHHTVVPTYLVTPRRRRAVLAQLVAVMGGGAALSVIGALLIALAVALGLTTTEYGFLVPAGTVVRLLAAAGFAGAAGAVLGAGVGYIIRNTGGAVTVTVLGLFVIPPLIVQLANETASWMPATLASVLSGVTSEVSWWSALIAMALWALVPAMIGLVTVERRDVI
jgi:ABC-2 type transport system permease protein